MSEPVSIGALLQPVTDHMDAICTPRRFALERTRRTAERDTIDRRTRILVYKRDYFACQWCGTQVGLQVDHIVPWSAGGSDSLNNLRTLCADCNTFRSNYDIDTVQRRAPVSYGCIECQPDWYTGEEELERVFCTYCGGTRLWVA